LLKQGSLTLLETEAEGMDQWLIFLSKKSVSSYSIYFFMLLALHDFFHGYYSAGSFSFLVKPLLDLKRDKNPLIFGQEI